MLLQSAGEKGYTEGSEEVSLTNEKFEGKESKQEKNVNSFVNPLKRDHIPENGRVKIVKICTKIIMKNEQKNVEENVLKKLKSIEFDCFQQENHKINEDTISEKKGIKRHLLNRITYVNRRCIKEKCFHNSRRCLVTLQKVKFTTIIFVQKTTVTISVLKIWHQ